MPSTFPSSARLAKVPLVDDSGTLGVGELRAHDFDEASKVERPRYCSLSRQALVSRTCRGPAASASIAVVTPGAVGSDSMRSRDICGSAPRPYANPYALLRGRPR